MPIFILLTGVISLIIVPQPAEAAPASTLNFQGRLMTATGGLVPDGSYNIQFNLYSQASGGASLWTETHLNNTTNAITVRNGYFTVYLGDATTGNPFTNNINWDQDLWLGMTVRGSGACSWAACLPADNEMTPRFKLSAVPYAFRAGAVVDSAGNAFTGDDLIQKAPSTVQTVNSALAAIRFNQSGSGGLLQLQGDGADVFTVAKDGSTILGGGLTLGDSTSTTAGTIRWSGTDFEGFDGVQWISLTQGGGGGGGGGGSSPGTTVVKTAADTITNDATLNNDDELFFAVGANETWAFRFVVQGNSATQPDFQFAVSAPAGSTCRVGFSDEQQAASSSNVACGVSSGLIPGTGANDVYEIVGTVTTGSTAGNVVLQWAQNSTSGNNTSVLAGSYLFASQVGTASPSTTFQQGGNAFAGTAVIGTTDNNGMTIITNNAAALAFSSSGDATFSDSVTVSSGGLTITGGIDNNSGGITEAGSISGLTSLSGSGALTLASGGSGDLTFDSASGIIVLADTTLRRSGAGTTTIDLFDAGGGTTLSILNSNGTQTAGLLVEGSITANGFSGDGSGLTGIDGAAISSGTIADARLSTNVVLLNQNQTFTGTPTFDSGIILGNSLSTTAGALRWSGTDFEGYDGIQWVSLTSGGGGGGGGSPSPAMTTVTKPSNESVSSTITPQNDDHLFFSAGANETWSFRFVVQANTPAAAGIVFAVTAPSGSTCRVGFIDQQTAASQSNVACGVTSTALAGTGSNEVYEITGTVTLGATAGNVRLQWAQGSSNGTNTTVLAGSYLNASIDGGSQVFLQGGNNFGGTAILGTTGNNNLNFITNNSTALSLTTSNQALFTGEIIANSGLTVGDNAADGFTIVSSNVTVSNGLNFDSNTFVINAGNNRIGIGTGTTTNLLTINDATTADGLAQVLLATDATTNKGLVIQGESGQTANLFEVQNNNGVVLGGFSANGGLVLGLSTVTSSATISRNIALPDSSGTVCLSNSTNCGYLQLASGSFQTDATANNTIAINKTNATGNLVALQRNGGAVFTVANTGALQIQASSSTALDIRNTSGTSFFSVDTSTGIVRVGPATADANGVLFVLDTRNTSGDPTGENGGMYYNSALGKFRCYENGRWGDCMATSVQDDVTLSSAAASISLTIPSSATNLQCYLQTPGRSVANGIYLRFNNVSTGNPYTYNVLQNLTGANNNTATQSSAGANQIQLTGNGTNTGGATMTVNIANYTSNNKTVDWTGSYESGAASTSNFKGSGSYVNTSSAISSVQFVTSTGNFNSGTRAWCEAR